MENYLRLLDKIDRFAAELRRRHPEAFACAPGCADCCVAGIRVWRIEFDRIGSAVLPERETSPLPRCPFLDADRRCSIYDARPAVCRLWGAPLLFRRDDAATEPLVQEASQPQRQSQTPGGLITCCPKNYREGTPFERIAASDTVNMEIILSALAAINHVHCKGIGEDPTRRFALADLCPPNPA